MKSRERQRSKANLVSSMEFSTKEGKGLPLQTRALAGSLLYFCFQGAGAGRMWENGQVEDLSPETVASAFFLEASAPLPYTDLWAWMRAPKPSPSLQLWEKSVMLTLA